ncbi:MAG: hypothetical protein P1T08_12910 [Acidimicrobiia bacterium]|nr:hypothetical protein [Acidimicrobiia bacterium]
MHPATDLAETRRRIEAGEPSVELTDSLLEAYLFDRTAGWLDVRAQALFSKDQYGMTGANTAMAVLRGVAATFLGPEVAGRLETLMGGRP